eukprot:895846-Pelagomonas_calceolata.AAC.2
MAAQENLFKCLSMPECIQGMKEGLQPGSLANQTLFIGENTTGAVDVSAACSLFSSLASQMKCENGFPPGPAL